MEGVSRSKRRAEQSIAEANRLIMVAKEAQSVEDPATAEQLLRQSLRKIGEASHWQPDVPAYRTFLHRVGRSVHDAFGCQLEFRDGQYWVNCPVLLLHNSQPPSVAQEYSLPKADLLRILPAEDRETIAYGETMIYCHHCTECDGDAGEARSKPSYFSA
jgi:hypothetical protein